MKVGGDTTLSYCGQDWPSTARCRLPQQPRRVAVDSALPKGMDAQDGAAAARADPGAPAGAQVGVGRSSNNGAAGDNAPPAPQAGDDQASLSAHVYAKRTKVLASM